jgi:hypothetical protein
MTTRIRRFFLLTLLVLPFASYGQFVRGSGNARERLTLLTGPTLTAPARQLTLHADGWTTSSVAATGAGVSAADTTALDREINALRLEIQAAESKLQRLLDQRDAMLSQRNPATTDQNALRFKSELPPTPTSLPRPSLTPDGSLKFRPD